MKIFQSKGSFDINNVISCGNSIIQDWKVVSVVAPTAKKLRRLAAGPRKVRKTEENSVACQEIFRTPLVCKTVEH